MSTRLGGVNRISFIPSSGDIPPNTIVLVSGSVAYLRIQEKIVYVSIPCLFLVDEHVQSKSLPSSCSLTWHRLLHEVFGGSTQFTALIGHRLNDTFILPSSNHLIRTILVATSSAPPSHDDANIKS
eukprot:scaffold143881_cov62-Attheya_sp.AAC.4